MKKFEFTLERIYCFKQTLLDKEKLTLATLRAERAKIEADIAYITAQIKALDDEKTTMVVNGTTIFDLQRLEYQVSVSHKILKELNLNLDLKDYEVQRQLKIVMLAKSEVQGLEKLKDKQIEDYQYNLAKETSDEIGEMISGKIVRERIENEDTNSM